MTDAYGTGDLLKPNEVASATRWSTTDDYRDVVALLPNLSRRYADGEDVASVARVLAGPALDSGKRGTHAAGVAVKRAAARLHRAYVDAAPEVPAGDTRDGDIPGTYLPRATFPAPDGCATWRTADTVATALSLVDDDTRDLLRTAYREEHADARARYGVSALKVASTLAGREVKAGRATSRVAAALVAAHDAVREHAADVVAVLDLESASNGKGTDLPRYADTLTGKASPCVCWGPTHGPALADGTRPAWQAWATLPDGRTVTADDRATLLPLLSLLTGDHGDAGTVREVKAADVIGQADDGTRPLSAVPGVSPGMAWGSTHAGQGTPFRARVSSKRKRDGGIGGPMTRA